MAQTSLAASAIDAEVYWSKEGSTWHDVSGAVTTVTPGGGERTTGEAYTLDGDTASLTKGKREPVEITVNVLYTEGTVAPDMLGDMWDYYEAGSANYFKYYPQGSSNWCWTSDAGYITTMTPPEADASSGDPLAVEIAFRAPKFTKS